MQQENFEPPHYAVRTRGGCSYKTTTTGRASSSSPIAARGLDVPGKRLPRGVAHPRYACGVCALASASWGSPTRASAIPGGTSTSSSAMQQEDLFIEPAGALRCSHPGRVLLQDRDAQESERMPVPPGKDEHQFVRSAAGELAHRASWRATLFAPGAGAPTRLRCPEGRLRCPEGASLSPPYTRKMM